MGGLIPSPEWLLSEVKQQLIDQINKVQSELSELRRRVERLERGLIDDGK